MIQGEHNSDERKSRLTQFCRKNRLDDPGLQQTLSQLICPDANQSTTLDADQRGQQLDALAELVGHFSQQQPLILVVEDLHWIDASTREFVQRLIYRCHSGRLAMVATTRDCPDWLTPQLAESAHIRLEPMAETDSSTLIDQLSQSQPLDSKTKRRIIEHSQGSPLYLEELTRTVLEMGFKSQHEMGSTSEHTEIPLPTTLQDSLRARLDQLGPDAVVAQFMAVLGRRFSQSLLLNCAPFDEQQLYRTLAQLQQQQILIRHQGSGDPVFEFRHMLLRQSAYESILNSERKRYHRHIADRIQTRLPHLVRSSPQLLASHYTQAEAPRQAIDYHRQAAAQAVNDWAHQEAANQLQKALTLSHQLADEKARRQTELQLLLELSGSLRLLERADEGIALLERALLLAEQIGDDRALAQIHNLYGNLCFGRSDAEACRQHHRQAIEHARQSNAIEHQAKALSGLGDAHLLDGTLLSAHNAYDACIEHCQHHQLDAPIAINLTLRGHIRLYLNRLDESANDIEQAIALAQQRQDLRTEMISRGSCLAKTLCEQGRYSEADKQLIQALQQARKLQIPRFETLYLLFQIRTKRFLDQSPETLNALALQAIELARRQAFHYNGAIVFGAAALVSRDLNELQRRLEQGAELLTEQAASQNFLWFLRDAIEVCLRWSLFDQARAYADRLATHTHKEPAPWSDLYIELAQHAEADSAVRERLADSYQAQGMVAAAQLLRTLGG